MPPKGMTMTSTTEPGTTQATAVPKPQASDAHSRLSALVASAAGRPTQPSYSPFDGGMVGKVPVCTPGDVEAAIASARAAQRKWAEVPLRQRSAVVGRFQKLLLQREAEILDHIAQGLDNAQIAARLGLSEKTVRNHITRIFDKLEVENRSQAIVLARERGLGHRSRSI